MSDNTNKIATFGAQVTISTLILIFSMIQVNKDTTDKTLWIAIITLLLGVFINKPKLRR